MEVLTVGYIGNVILNLFVFLLLIAVYSYILKLEDTACACARHPNRDFIKQFSLFALVFLLIVTFLPMSYIIKTFGKVIAGIFAFVKFVFYIVCIVYFYMILDYTRYLINEKCKCSEDYRRGLIMAGSIIEIVILFLILLVIIILPILLNSIATIVQNMDGLETKVESAVRNPYQSIKNIPKSVNTASKMVKNIGKQTSKGFGKIIRRKT